ncbi:MAG TPA: hypothetical protein VGB73_12110 [Pyrinomonadaceae bacterium]
MSGLLPTGGALPQNFNTAATDVWKPSPRRRGVQQGILMMFIGMVLTPVLAVILDPPHGNHYLAEILVPLSAIIFFWGGILRMLYAGIFQEGPVRRKKHQAEQAYVAPSYAPSPLAAPGARAAAPVLPHAESIPARSFMPPARGGTSEIAAPPSVTESTTRLLDEQPDKQSR